MKPKAKKTVVPVIEHDVRKGVCVVCGRKGGEVTKASCPGYRTAAEAGTK